MDLLVLNKNFTAVRLLDRFRSLIWTDRYDSAGDFELVTDVSTLQYVEKGFYICNNESEHIMIAEDFEIESDVELGSYLKITGRSLESILDRRIVWSQTTLDGYLPGQVQRLLNQNAINPTDTNRAIPNMIFQSVTDTRITSMTIRAQYTGDNLYDVIVSICKEAQIGWKLTLNSLNQFVFSLYKGTDRSYDQSDVPYVIFSGEFDNLISSKYLESDKTLKTIALVGGEDEGSDRRMYTVGSTTETGLDRRELFVDARDISSNTGSEEEMTEEEYNALLEQRGKEKLAECQMTQTFEGQVDYKKVFKYREDFFVGDICQIENEYGIGCKIVVSEMVISIDESGETAYPTFASV